MTENNTHSTRRNSSRKSHSPTNRALLQHQTSLSSPDSPIHEENNSLSRSRQLWNIAIDSVLEHERTSPTSLSKISSNVDTKPIGWHNLTKR